MPELPEVETQCRDLIASGLPGKTVTDVRVLWERTLGGENPAHFSRRLRGGRVSSVSRYGKYCIISLESDLHLVIHLRMSGSLRYRSAEDKVDVHDRVVVSFGSEELAFHDPRKFGRMVLCSSLSRITEGLGPDLLDEGLEPAEFHHRITSRSRILKALLLDQRAVAGLGNIYADESLFAAGLHPASRSSCLTREDTDRLFSAVRRVLTRAVEYRGTSLGGGEGNFLSSGQPGRYGEFLQVYGRAGESCQRCTPAGRVQIERIVLSQRVSHYCPECQRLCC